MRIKWLALLLIASSAFSATCTSTPSTQAPTSSTSTWSCGHVPTASDDIAIATPVQLTNNLVGNTVTFYGGDGTFMGGTAQLSTDGVVAHSVTSIAATPMHLEYGCQKTAGNNCPTPYIIDTCTNSSAGKEVTFVSTSLVNGQYLFDHHIDAIAPNASIAVNICHSIISDGGGGMIDHEGVFGSLDNSTWTISTSEIVGTGRQIKLNALYGLNLSSVSWAGGAQDFLFLSGVDLAKCSMFAVTITSNTASGNNFTMIGDQVGVSPCTMDSMAYETWSWNGLTTAGANISNSILKSFFQDGVTFDQIAVSLTGTVSRTATIFHNAIDGFGQDIWAENYAHDSYNFLVQNNGIALGQGALFGDGAFCPYASDHDILTVDNDPFVGDSLLVLGSGSFGVACPLMSNETVYQGIQHQSGGQETVALGEFTGSAHLQIDNSAFHDSIVVSGNYGIKSRDTNTFLNNGTGGVGVYNDDVYTPNFAVQYSSFPGNVNFDNGVTVHPSNSLYGDTNFNPNFVDITQRFASCDATLGGTGTTDNVFGTEMFNRWTGAVPHYTPSQMVDCLRAGWVPQNTSAWNSGSSHWYIGAIQVGTQSSNATISGQSKFSGTAVML